jgi:hypothetical protein
MAGYGAEAELQGSALNELPANWVPAELSPHPFTGKGVKDSRDNFGVASIGSIPGKSVLNRNSDAAELES